MKVRVARTQALDLGKPTVVARPGPGDDRRG